MKQLLKLENIRLGVEVVLIITALFLIIGRSTPTTAAPIGAGNDSAPAEPAAVSWYQCITPNQVAVFYNRVHVHCASTNPAISGVSWFAVPTSPDSAAASRMMSIFQSAVLTTQPLYLYLDPSDTTGSTFGCASGDCRRVYGAELTK